jgi:hypothetical protein
MEEAWSGHERFSLPVTRAPVYHGTQCVMDRRPSFGAPDVCGERTWTATVAASLCVKCMVISGLPLRPSRKCWEVARNLVKFGGRGDHEPFGSSCLDFSLSTLGKMTVLSTEALRWL